MKASKFVKSVKKIFFRFIFNVRVGLNNLAYQYLN